MVDALYQWESDLGIVELLDVRPSSFAGCHWFYLDDLDGMRARPMSGAHIPVALCHCSAHRQITVLTIHVVRTWSRVITQPDAKVLDFDRWAFVDAFQRNDFAGSLLELLQLSQEIPEPWLGHNAVGSKDPHFVERSLWLLLGGQFTPNNFIFFQL